MFKQKSLVRIISASLLLLSGQAFAQIDIGEEEDSSNPMLEEIIVTATRVATDLMDTPIAVSSFTEEQLKQLGIDNVRDLNNVVPNMNITTDFESSAPIITMRGIRSTNTTEWGDPAVGVHYDGIYSPRPQGALALMFDIDRVEALRGPQGTLFGRNSTVGTLNIISKRPEFDEFYGRIEADAGRWNQRSFKGVLNIPVSDTFAIRAAAFVEKRDSNFTGYYDPNQWDQRYLPEGLPMNPTAQAATPAGNDPNFLFYWNQQRYEEVKADPEDFYNNIDQNAFRVSGYWKPSDDVSWLFSFERYEDQSAGGILGRDCARIADRPASINGGSCDDIWGDSDDFVAYVNVPGLNDMTQDSWRSHLTWDINDHTQLVYNLGFTSQERVGQIDLDQGYYLWDQMLKWIDTDYDSWSHEILLKATPTDRLTYVAGYFNFEEDNYMNGQYHGAMAGVAHWLQPERIIKSDALFAQATYGLTDKLYLTVGARHTSDSKQDIGGRNYGCGWGNTSCHSDAWGQVPWGLINWGAWGDLSQQSEEFLAAAPFAREFLNSLAPTHYDYPNTNYGIDSFNDIKESWSKTTWRVGLDYDIDEDTMIYGYVANGYKGGGLGDVLIKPSNGERFDTSYNAEEVVTYEFGIKKTMLDGALNFRANAFYSDYQDQQFTAWTIFDVIIIEVPDQETGELVEEREELGTFLTRNAAKSKIFGVELEMEWAPWEGGHIGGYLTHLRTEIDSDYWKRWGAEPAQVFKDYVDGPLDTSKPWFRNLKGNDLAWSPEWALTVNFSHTFEFDSGATLTPFLNVHWEDDMYFDIDNRDKWNLDPSVLNEVHDLDIYSDKRDSYVMATASVNYRSADDVWFAEAYVYNLTDEDVNWWQSYANQTPLAAKSQRTMGLRFGYNF